MKKLIDMRDKAAELFAPDYDSNKYETHTLTGQYLRNRSVVDYKRGYDQCIKDLMPEIERLLDVVDRYRYVSVENDEVLRRWREFVGEP